MAIKPLADRIVVKRLEAQDKTKSGIIVPDSAKERPQEGKVIAVGTGKILEDGGVKALEIKNGDRVLYGKYSGTEVTIEGDEFLILKFPLQKVKGSGCVQQRPVAHARLHLPERTVQRAADAAIVEGQHREAALGEEGGELAVVGLRHAGRGHHQHGAAIRRRGLEQRRAEPVAVARRQLHECHSMEPPPTRISPSMKSTCRCACMRATSQAPRALPGIEATPITTPVKTCWLSIFSKRAMGCVHVERNEPG